MTTLDQTTEPPAGTDTAWYALSSQDAARRLEVDAEDGAHRR